jgi:type IV secretion system protein VirD4
MSIFLGCNDGHFVTSDSYQHTLLIAPTGTGNGVAYYITNLLFCEDSMIVHDIKGENYELTRRYRESIGQKTYFWNPFDNKTNKYNPFDFIDKSNDHVMYSDIDKIARILINGNEHYDFLARQLLIDTAVSMSNEGMSFGKILKKIKNINTESSTTLQKHLELWNNPLIDNATSSSDFDIQKFRDEKSTLYIVVERNEMNRLQPILNFMYQHFIDLLTKKHHEEIKNKHGVRVFIDEFPTLGKMPEFETGVAYLRGYKVNLFLTIQNIPQLKSIYQDGVTNIIDNMSYRIAFTVFDSCTAEYISKMCFIDVNELMQLGKDEQIMFNACEASIKMKKFKYFENDEFKKRVSI